MDILRTSPLASSTMLATAPDRLTVTGRRPLDGTIEVEGCKISCVPILASILLTDTPVILENYPKLLDMAVLLEAIQRLGGRVDLRDSELEVTCRDISRSRTAQLTPDLLSLVHGSLYLFPALLVRHQRVTLPLCFGGCQIGERPIQHIVRVLQAFGARVEIDDNITASLPSGAPHGCRINLCDWYGPELNKFISGATKTALMAAVLATGETEIRGAWWGKPIVALSRFLRTLGAQIEGEGSRLIRVQGVPSLGGGRFRIPHDHHVTGTLIGAIGMAKGKARLAGACLEGLENEQEAFREFGVDLRASDHDLSVACDTELRGVALSTQDISTDLGPVFAALMTVAVGHSELKEVVWENRFGYAQEFQKLGGRNQVDGQVLKIQGTPDLYGGHTRAQDLRGAAALLLAGLAAKGHTVVTGTEHLIRGYADLPEQLRNLNAGILPSISMR